ncbi:hypothetical protein TVAG_160250 [Trichomonas vaginalis G3]|uniref:Right handed beta helix domain-containing protein n=1 Tax=Trichomonas vaginalis (strain ATCC PRA-98 / G3) TaxID=412133 RepID=A2DUW7_TRIV3|nr:hypothetical protein TVAGG3_0259150 [Trichomonas vaginalis G3]EAY15852.1 hypothetical protein TVAG_160250 [Trichomonas vaginalis G3]KAI5524979.1 hypothetical protein TVAGG3_0259150 [Trichomonas vaginalis G3]|eukprot:XP_001328075.1 hypothetical protein [Trichomonas vaginalis G3]
MSLSDVWNRFFGGTIPVDWTKKEALISNYGNFHVHEVLYSFINYTAINISGNDNNKLLVSNSVFESGFADLNNYSIVRIAQYLGACVQYRVCSSSIAAANKMSFSHSAIAVSNSDSYKNYILDSTIINTETIFGSISSYYGNILYKNINISHSHLTWSGIYKNGYANSIIRFSNFLNNSAEDGFIYHNCIGDMSYCIINENKIREHYSIPDAETGAVYQAYENCQITISHCMIINNTGYSLFFIGPTSNLTANSCFIDTSLPSYYNTTIPLNSPVIYTIDSLSIQNDNFVTALCSAVHPISYLNKVILEKVLFEKGKDKFIRGTVFLDERRIEPLNIITQIDDFPINSEYKDDLNSQYSFSISIPDELHNGTHSLSVRYTDNGIELSNTVHVNFDFVISFSLELDDPSKKTFNKTIDTVIPVSGRGYFVSDFSLHCSVNDIEVALELSMNKTESISTFSFDGNCSIKDFPLEEGQYTLKVWVSTTTGESKMQSKQFMFYRNHHFLDVTTRPKEIYRYILDRNIVISGTVSDLDCDEIINVTASIDNLTSKSTIINIDDKYDHEFNLNLDIPENLKSEFHTINLTSCEKNNYCLNKTYIFKYLYNEPVLSILEKPSFPIFINKQKFINLVLSLQDIDGNSNISIYHKINNSESYNLLNKTIRTSDPVRFNYDIPINDDISVGSCQIEIIAEDQIIFSQI